jgi:hypothetical protein
MNDEFHNPYPDYEVLLKWDTPSWNEASRKTVGERLSAVPERQFLPPHEYQTLEAACHRLVPQPEREEPIPIAPWIDQKSFANRTEGYRYAGMPPLQETWRAGLKGIDEEARYRFDMPFVELSASNQDEILACLASGDTHGEVFQSLSAKQFFSAHLLYECASIYYAHPQSWNEIGFGGPASPRGYVRLGANRRDPWEAPFPRDNRR